MVRAPSQYLIDVDVNVNVNCRVSRLKRQRGKAPNVPSPGTYQVYARWVAASTHASNAPFTVKYNGGSATVTKSQRSSTGQWVLLGSYVYNALRQRTRKTVGTTTTVFHYDTGGHLIAETKSTGQLIRAYVYADDAPVAQIEPVTVLPPEIVVDNTQATFTGTWATSTSIAGYYGTNYRTNAKARRLGASLRAASEESSSWPMRMARS